MKARFGIQDLRCKKKSEQLNSRRLRSAQGFMLPLVLVFGAMFLAIALALAAYLLAQQAFQQKQIKKEEAFNIAEAGLDYYAWHLAHCPTDLQDSTDGSCSGTGSGPYVHSYTDPEGGDVGTFSLSLDGNVQCGEPTAVDVTSTGATAADPTDTATVAGRYAKESVASYSYILNSQVEAGATRTILGRYHGNNGIRMDATNLSTVESSLATWDCTTDYGCNPEQRNAPGVVGSGSGSALWKLSVPNIDFTSISVDLATLKNAAKTGGGLYFPKLSGSQTSRGYHLIFNSNGTVTVYKVTGTVGVWGETPTYDWQEDYDIIGSSRRGGLDQTLVDTYTIPSDCSVIFVEDRAWIEGTVSGKVTVAVADLTGDTYNPDAILENNITYTKYDGSDGLTVVAAGNVLIPLDAPSTMELHGIFIAQNGYYGMNYYCYGGGCSRNVPSTYRNDILKDTLTTVGTIVSNGRTGTSWANGDGDTVSGYETRNDSYDGNLATDPPPFTPYTSSQYDFVRWREE